MKYECFVKFLVETQLHINDNAILERNWPYYARRGSWCWTKCNFPKPGAVKVGHTILAYLPFIYLLLILLCSFLWLNYYHEYWSQTSRQMQIKINHYWYSFKGRHKGGLFLESCFIGDWSKHRAPYFEKNGILLPKLFWSTVRKNCSIDREKLLKFEAEGREFEIFWDL